MRPFLSHLVVLSFSLLAFATLAQPRGQTEQSTAPADATSTERTNVPAPAEHEQRRLLSYRVRIVGEWEEFSPSRNFIDFSADGKVVLYLKKGEVGNLKTLDGTWTVEDENRLRVSFAVNGQSIQQDTTLSFDGEEMLLTSEGDVVTRHRRRSGPLPEEYRW